jgi:hypothetical protein
MSQTQKDKYHMFLFVEIEKLISQKGMELWSLQTGKGWGQGRKKLNKGHHNTESKN